MNIGARMNSVFCFKFASFDASSKEDVYKSYKSLSLCFGFDDTVPISIKVFEMHCTILRTDFGATLVHLGDLGL